MRHMKKISVFLATTLIIAFCLLYCDNYFNKDAGSLDVALDFQNGDIDQNDFEITILDKNSLIIDKERVNSDYGIGHLNNRWELEEIDLIMGSISGIWQIDEYVGFVDSSIYYPDLFDRNDNLSELEKKQLLLEYEIKIEDAKKQIPELLFSIKKRKDFIEWKDTNSNLVFVDGVHESSTNIILSIDRRNDDYPIFADQTTISRDFHVEYPVIYIKFFIISSSDAPDYQLATLIISADDKFLILIDGAFYSLREVPF